MVDRRLYRTFMVVTKYLMFFVSVVYFVTSIGAVLDKDVTYLLLLIKVPAWIVAYGILLSKVFGYCVTHRIPMYYMLETNLIFILRSHFGGSQAFYLWLFSVLFALYLLAIYITNKQCKP